MRKRRSVDPELRVDLTARVDEGGVVVQRHGTADRVSEG